VTHRGGAFTPAAREFLAREFLGREPVTCLEKPFGLAAALAG
jgi:hypothetical protein